MEDGLSNNWISDLQWMNMAHFGLHTANGLSKYNGRKL